MGEVKRGNESEMEDVVDVVMDDELPEEEVPDDLRKSLEDQILDVVKSDMIPLDQVIEGKMRAKVLELSTYNTSMRDKWKEFDKFSRRVESDLRGVSKKLLRGIPLKKFEYYYKAVLAERDKLATQIKESEVSHEDTNTRG
jgi:hypothetical protein